MNSSESRNADQSKRQSVSTKIFWVAASFGLPVAVLVYLMVANIQSQIGTARAEVAGNAYLRPLVSLLYGLQTHQIAVACHSGSCQDVEKAREAVDSAFAELKTAQLTYGEQLEFTPEGLAKRGRQHQMPDTVEKEWHELVSNSSQLSAVELTARHHHLTSDVRTMIEHAGDTSGLVLDSDLDSYYLMDAEVVQVPDIMARLARTAETGGRQWGEAPTLRDGEKVAGDLALLSAAFERAHTDTETSINENKNIHGGETSLGLKMAPVLRELEREVTAYTDRAGAAARGEPVSAEELAKLERGAESAALAFSKAGADELNALLEARIQHFANSRNLALFLAALALAAASALASFLARTIVKPLDKLLRSLGPGATLLSASVERVADTSRSGVATPGSTEILCEELSAHADDMRKAVYELALHVQGGAAASRAALVAQGGGEA